MRQVYLAIKYHEDLRNRGLIEQLSDILKQDGFETVCAVRDLEKWGEVHLSSENLMEKSFRAIDACDAILIELSEKGVGIGIEAGYAYAKGKPIIAIAKKGSTVSSTLQGISSNIYFYNQLSDLNIQQIMDLADNS